MCQISLTEQLKTFIVLMVEAYLGNSSSLSFKKKSSNLFNELNPNGWAAETSEPLLT